MKGQGWKQEDQLGVCCKEPNESDSGVEQGNGRGGGNYCIYFGARDSRAF